VGTNTLESTNCNEVSAARTTLLAPPANVEGSKAFEELTNLDRQLQFGCDRWVSRDEFDRAV